MKHREFTVGKQTLEVSALVFQVKLRAFLGCRSGTLAGRGHWHILSVTTGAGSVMAMCLPPSQSGWRRCHPGLGYLLGKPALVLMGPPPPEPGPGVYVEEAKLVMCSGMSV